MPQFAYCLKLTRIDLLATGPTPSEADCVSRHFQYLQAALQQGQVIFAGRTLTTGEETFGIAVLNVPDEPTARQFMQDDPAVREGVMNATLYPYHVALIAERNATGS